VHSRAVVAGCVLMHGADIGRGAHLNKVIVDKGVVIPADTKIGLDHDEDRARGFHVSAGGVVVIGKGQIVPGP